jgi:hypothetical protein
MNVGGLLVAMGICCVAWSVTAQESAKPAAAAKPSPEAEIMRHLQAGPWTIEMTSLGATSKPVTDTLTFEQRKMTSKRLGSEGYPSSNISLNIGDDGVPVWETMQTKEGGGVVFWRGELHGSTMRGIISKHPVEGPSIDFSFKGAGPEAPAVAAAPEVTAAPSTEAPKTPAVVAAPAGEAPPQLPAAPAKKDKKKRKGWF